MPMASVILLEEGEALESFVSLPSLTSCFSTELDMIRTTTLLKKLGSQVSDVRRVSQIWVVQESAYYGGAKPYNSRSPHTALATRRPRVAGIASCLPWPGREKSLLWSQQMTFRRVKYVRADWPVKTRGRWTIAAGYHTIGRGPIPPTRSCDIHCESVDSVDHKESGT